MPVQTPPYSINIKYLMAMSKCGEAFSKLTNRTEQENFIFNYAIQGENLEELTTLAANFNTSIACGLAFAGHWNALQAFSQHCNITDNFNPITFYAALGGHPPETFIPQLPKEHQISAAHWACFGYAYGNHTDHLETTIKACTQRNAPPEIETVICYGFLGGHDFIPTLRQHNQSLNLWQIGKELEQGDHQQAVTQFTKTYKNELWPETSKKPALSIEIPPRRAPTPPPNAGSKNSNVQILASGSF